MKNWGNKNKFLNGKILVNKRILRNFSLSFRVKREKKLIFFLDSSGGGKMRFSWENTVKQRNTN